MITVTDNALRTVVDKQIAEHKEVLSLLFHTLYDIRDGKYPFEYVNCIVQRGRGELDVYDAFVFLHIHDLIQNGKIAVVAFDLGTQCPRDFQGEIINHSLKRLPSHVSARFWGGTRGEDGAFHWRRPIRAVVASKGGSERFFCIAPPKGLPLEVGSNAASKMMYSLLGGIGGPTMGVARWPYGSQHIFVFTCDYIGRGSSQFEAMKHTVRIGVDPWLVWGAPR